MDILGREVQRWTQPLFQPARDGIIAFIIKKISGVYHFLVQAKFEAGNFDKIELAPTIQTMIYKSEIIDPALSHMLELIDNESISTIHYDTIQSEEGGRFFHDTNRNVICEIQEDFEIKPAGSSDRGELKFEPPSYEQLIVAAKELESKSKYLAIQTYCQAMGLSNQNINPEILNQISTSPILNFIF